MTFDIVGHKCEKCGRVWAPERCITEGGCNGKAAICPNCIINWRGAWSWQYKEDPFVKWVKEVLNV